MTFKTFFSIICIVLFLAGCSTRELAPPLMGSTAQRLVTHSIDDLVRKIDGQALSDLKGKKVFVRSYFLDEAPLQEYADQRLAIELQSRFGAQVVASQQGSDQVMTVFYTSMGTDLDNFGISIPLGYVPGFEQYSELSVIALEKFHGISEMYFYIGETGTEYRSEVIHAKVKTDALGLPFITIPLSNIDRHETDMLGNE